MFPKKNLRQRAVITLRDTPEGFTAELTFEPSIKDRATSSPAVNAALRLAMLVRNAPPGALGAPLTPEALQAIAQSGLLHPPAAESPAAPEPPAPAPGLAEWERIAEGDPLPVYLTLVGYARRHGLGTELASFITERLGPGGLSSVRPEEWSDAEARLAFETFRAAYPRTTAEEPTAE